MRDRSTGTFLTWLWKVMRTLFAGLLARSQYPEGPANDHLGTGFSWFPCVHKGMLRWFPRLQATAECFSFSPPDLKFLDPYFVFMYMCNNHSHGMTVHLQLNTLLLFSSSSSSLIFLPPKKKLIQSRYRPGVAQSFPGS